MRMNLMICPTYWRNIVMLLPSCMNNAYVSSYPINPHVDIVSWITVPIFTCGLGSLLHFLVDSFPIGVPTDSCPLNGPR